MPLDDKGNELSPNFAIMQEKLEQPSCFGKWTAKDQKCGACWFWPKCKADGPKKVQAVKAKPAVKVSTSKKAKEVKEVITDESNDTGHTESAQSSADTE